jgi:hypothetical protein
MPKWPSRKQPKPSSKATCVDPLCEGLSLSWVEGPITHKGKTSELGDLAFGRAKVCCTGSHGEGDEPKAYDERTREVRPRSRSCEVHERSWATRGGVDGAKGGDQGKCGLAKHAPNSVSGWCVTCAGSHTTRRAFRLSRQTPEVEAGCGKAARPVLCGGRIAICVPTAILISQTPQATASGGSSRRVTYNPFRREFGKTAMTGTNLSCFPDNWIVVYLSPGFVRLISHFRERHVRL